MTGLHEKLILYKVTKYITCLAIFLYYLSKLAWGTFKFISVFFASNQKFLDLLLWLVSSMVFWVQQQTWETLEPKQIIYKPNGEEWIWYMS